jgi:hypothetical protein
MSEVLHAHGAVVVDDEPLVSAELLERLGDALALVLGEVPSPLLTALSSTLLIETS